MGFKSYTLPKEEPKYEIVKHFGKLTNNPGHYNKELNLISWNGNPPKFDIRGWITTEEGEVKMQKGVTFSAEEMENLTELLIAIKEEDEDDVENERT